MKALIIIGSVSGTLFFAWMVWMLTGWSLYRDGAKLKFKNFKKFYDVNPKRWYLKDGNVTCYRLNCGYEGDDFYFGFIDFIKYSIWKRKIDRHKQSKKDSKATARMLEAVRADIQAAKEAEAKQKQEAMEKWLRSFNHKEIDNIILKLKELEANDKV